MKALNYTQIRPPGRLFDNPVLSLIVYWMHPLRLKAIRGFAAGAAILLAAVGCETDGETVPVRNAGLPAESADVRPVLVAQAETPAPEKSSKDDLSSDVPPPLTTAEATAKAIAAVGVTNAP